MDMERVVYLAPYVGDMHAPRLLALASRLADEGATLAVAQTRRESALASYAQPRRARLLSRLDFTELDAPQRWRSLVAAWRYLRERDPHAVLVIGYPNDATLLGLVYAKVRRRRVVFFFNSKADDQPRSGSRERLKAVILRRFDGAVVAGERHRTYLRSIGFHKPVELGYNAVDNEYFARRARLVERWPGLADPGVSGYVLCVSRLVERKRVDRAIEIFHRSGVHEKGCSLLIVGKGDREADLRAQAAAAGIADHVRFIESIPSTVMPLYYARARVLLLTSEYDQWGNCVNEAMACGVPAIVTERCGVANELLVDGKGGMVISGDEVDRPAAYLARLVADQRYWDEVSATARAAVRDWSPERFADSVVAVLTELGAR